ncbi:MAG: hypothetical protein NTW96_03780 [Planctomycetia bacterium]|nr:hypothetical protein [Planctomycetia bacterium]
MSKTTVTEADFVAAKEVATNCLFVVQSLLFAANGLSLPNEEIESFLLDIHDLILRFPEKVRNWFGSAVSKLGPPAISDARGSLQRFASEVETGTQDPFAVSRERRCESDETQREMDRLITVIQGTIAKVACGEARKTIDRSNLSKIGKVKNWLACGRLSDEPISCGGFAVSTVHEAVYSMAERLWLGIKSECVKQAIARGEGIQEVRFWDSDDRRSIVEILAIVCRRTEGWNLDYETLSKYRAKLDLESARGLAAWRAATAESGEIQQAESPKGVLTDLSHTLPTDENVNANVQRSVIVVEDEEHEAAAHHCQIIKALVEANGLNRTGPWMNKRLPGCRGKKISREIANLEEQIPALRKYLKHDGNKGYRIVQELVR